MIAIPSGGPTRAEEKNALREFFRHRRAIAPTSAAAEIARQERALAASFGHEGVAVYLSRRPEPQTDLLVANLLAIKVRVLVPVVDDWRVPHWGWITETTELRPGRRGILGPSVANGSLTEVTLSWCPGLAVSETGVRLGTGGGWYDRSLAGFDGLVGVLVDDDEVVPQLPSDPWDVPVHQIVTPTRTLNVTIGGPA